MPFLKIFSGVSKELDVLEDARKGDIYNTVTGAVLKGKDGIKVIPVPTSVGSSVGPPEAKERALLLLSILRASPCRRRSGLPKIIKTMSKTVRVSTSKRRTSTLLSCLHEDGLLRPRWLR